MKLWRFLNANSLLCLFRRFSLVWWLPSSQGIFASPTLFLILWCDECIYNNFVWHTYQNRMCAKTLELLWFSFIWWYLIYTSNKLKLFSRKEQKKLNFFPQLNVSIDSIRVTYHGISKKELACISFPRIYLICFLSLFFFFFWFTSCSTSFNNSNEFRLWYEWCCAHVAIYAKRVHANS